jgi:hypothetical protein
MLLLMLRMVFSAGFLAAPAGCAYAAKDAGTEANSQENPAPSIPTTVAEAIQPASACQVNCSVIIFTTKAV